MERNNLLNTIFTQFDRHTDKQTGNAVFTFQISGAGKNFLFVFQDGFRHFDCRRSRRVVGAACFQESDNFRAAASCPCGQSINTFRCHQLCDRNTRHGGKARQRYHRIPVAAQHERMNIFHRNIQFHGNKSAEPCGIQNTGHTDDTLFRETAFLHRHMTHGIKGVTDNDQNGIGRIFGNLPCHVFHNATVGGQKVITAHARFAGNSRRNNDDIGMGRSLISVCACYVRVVFLNRRGLG